MEDRLRFVPKGLRKQLEMQKNCQNCKYYAVQAKTCDYYLITGQRRTLICKSGDKCTVKETGEIKRTFIKKPLKPLPKDEWLDYQRARKK